VGYAVTHWDGDDAPIDPMYTGTPKCTTCSGPSFCSANGAGMRSNPGGGTCTDCTVLGYVIGTVLTDCDLWQVSGQHGTSSGNTALDAAPDPPDMPTHVELDTIWSP
jgi:hypothetical protein